MFVNSKIYYTEDDSYPPFICEKGAIALSFTVNNEGEVMLTHSRNDTVLKQYDDICDHLFPTRAVGGKDERFFYL